MMLLDLLRTPSSFSDDPRGFAFNQAGHAGVGMLLAWALGAWWPVALGYAVWEIVQWRRFGGHDWDGLQDWAFVVIWVPLQRRTCGCWCRWRAISALDI